jgi:hypothetical protein
MQKPNLPIVKASVPLWIGAFLLITMYGLAASLSSLTLTYAALVCSALFALYGIGFGVWVGRKLSEPG